MKTLQTLIFILLVSISFYVKANTEIQPRIINTISVSKIDAGTVQINASILFTNAETIVIERSYNNKDFQEIALLMCNDNENKNQQINIKNKIKTNAKKVYYRVVKVNTTTSGTVIATTKI